MVRNYAVICACRSPYYGADCHSRSREKESPMDDTSSRITKMHSTLRCLFGINRRQFWAGIVFLGTITAAYHQDAFDPQDQIPAYTGGAMNFTQYPTGSAEYTRATASYAMKSPVWSYDNPVGQDAAGCGTMLDDLPSYSAPQPAAQPISLPIARPASYASFNCSDADIDSILAEFVTDASSELFLFFGNALLIETAAAEQYFPPPSSALLREDVRAILDANPEKLQEDAIRSILCFALSCAAPVPLSVENLIQFAQTLNIKEAAMMLSIALMYRQKVGIFYLFACVFSQAPVSINETVQLVSEIASETIVSRVSPECTLGDVFKSTSPKMKSLAFAALAGYCPSLNTIALPLLLHILKAPPDSTTRTQLKQFIRKHLLAAYPNRGPVQIALPEIAADWYRFTPLMPVERVWWYLARLNIQFASQKLSCISYPAVHSDAYRSYVDMMPPDLCHDVLSRCITSIEHFIDYRIAEIAAGKLIKAPAADNMPPMIDEIICLARCTPSYASRETTRAIVSTIANHLYDTVHVDICDAYRQYLDPFIFTMLNLFYQETIARHGNNKQYLHIIMVDLLSAIAWYCGQDTLCSFLSSINMETIALLQPNEMQRLLILLDIKRSASTKNEIMERGAHFLSQQFTPEQFAQTTEFIYTSINTADVSPMFNFIVAVAYMTNPKAFISHIQRSQFLDEEYLPRIMHYLAASDQHPSYIAFLFSNAIFDMHRRLGIKNILNGLQAHNHPVSLRELSVSLLDTMKQSTRLNLLFAHNFQILPQIVNQCAVENTSGDVQALSAEWAREGSNRIVEHNIPNPAETSSSTLAFTFTSPSDVYRPVGVKRLLEAIADIWICLLSSLAMSTDNLLDYTLCHKYENTSFCSMPLPLQYVSLFRLGAYVPVNGFIVQKADALHMLYLTLPPIWRLLYAVRRDLYNYNTCSLRKQPHPIYNEPCSVELCKLAEFLQSIDSTTSEYNSLEPENKYIETAKEGIQALKNLLPVCLRTANVQLWTQFFGMWALSPIGKYYFNTHKEELKEYTTVIQGYMKKNYISTEDKPAISTIINTLFNTASDKQASASSKKSTKSAGSEPKRSRKRAASSSASLSNTKR